MDGDGVVRITSPYLANGAGTETIHDPPARMADAARGVIAEFRALFPLEQLRDEGTTTFHGRTVHAYSHRRGLTFYIDPETARLVGSRHDEVETVIETYEMLPATPENVAELGG